MALTNAEKQLRHRERVRGRLKLAAMVQSFQQQVRHQITEAGGDLGCPSTIGSHIDWLMRTPEGAMVLTPFLAQAMEIPLSVNPANSPINHP